MNALKALNLTLSFILELCLLIALAYGGWQTSDNLFAQIAFGIGVPLLVAVIWGVFAAPASRRRLTQPWLTLLKIVLFSAGTIALFTAGQPIFAAIFFILFLVNLFLAFVWQQH